MSNSVEDSTHWNSTVFNKAQCTSGFEGLTCNLNYQEYRGTTFWMVLAITVPFYLFYSAVPPLQHSVILTILGKKRNKFGKFRGFATIGYGLVAVIVGYSMGAAAKDGKSNFIPNYVTYLVVYSMTAYAIYNIQVCYSMYYFLI